MYTMEYISQTQVIFSDMKLWIAVAGRNFKSLEIQKDHLHPLQAVNCCRNSRLVVDEDDLTWFKN